jgi:hypothetical protein
MTKNTKTKITMATNFPLIPCQKEMFAEKSPVKGKRQTL